MDLDALLQSATGFEQQIREVQRRLATEPDDAEALVSELEALVKRRDPILQEVGLTLIQALLEGCQLVIERPEPEVRPTTEPPVATQEAPESPPPAPDPTSPPPMPDFSGSKDDLLKFAKSLSSNIDDPETTANSGMRVLINTLGDFGSPVRVGSQGLFSQQVLHIRTAVDNLHNWPLLSQELQRNLLAMVVARARYLQDEVHPAFARKNDLDALARSFKAFTRYSAKERPGFVRGMQGNHTPTPRPTWFDSAAYWYQKLAEHAGLDIPAPPSVDTSTDVLLGQLGRTLNASPRPEILVRAVVSAIEDGLSDRNVELVRLVAPHFEILKDEPKLAGLCRAIEDQANRPHAGDSDSDSM